ncbi:MAG: HD domain-containing protein [Candidatus Sericytochromatia bacterium]|nr:HD domain-containing protein [Candidatus Tanganyikabacteria bacterium]
MVTGHLVSVLGGLCIAGAATYAAFLLWGEYVPRNKYELTIRLQPLRRHPIGRGVWDWLVEKGALLDAPDMEWLHTPMGTDPVAIGRHASCAEGYDEAHAARVADLARRLGGAAGLSPDVLAGLYEAGHLHDAGIEDWDVDLAFPGQLTADLRARLPEHVARGERLAREIAPDPQVACWVRWHHERYDGSGYPDGLVGDQIPLPAQILGLADTFEALTHRRPYREALDPQDALAELQRLAGIHFDPDLVHLFVRDVYPDILAQLEPLPVA